MRVDGFDGAAFGRIDEYKREMARKAAVLRERVHLTQALGDVVTGNILAQGLATIQEVSVRNETPTFNELFLNFIDDPDWVQRTDKYLVSLRDSLERRRQPKAYRQFIRDARQNPTGALFELNVYGLLVNAFPGTRPKPKVGRLESDVEVRLESGVVYVEATVLTKGDYHRVIDDYILRNRLNSYCYSTSGPMAESFSIARKVVKESAQTAEMYPNILCLSFFDTFPTSIGRKWAFEQLDNGFAAHANRLGDTSIIRRFDSIFEFSRSRFLRVHENRNVGASNRLSSEARQRLETVFEGAQLMIR